MLLTVEQVKERLKIPTGTTTDDAFIASQIAVVTTAIENYCNRSIVARNFEETFYGAYSGFTISPWEVQLYHFPIITLTEVVVKNGSSTETFTANDYIIHKPTATIRNKPYSDARSLPNFFQEMVFKYRTGYATIPADIQDVALALVTERYNKYKNGIDINFGSDVQSVSIPGVISISYDYSLEDNDSQQSYGAIIGKYRNVLNYYRSDRAIFKGSGELKYYELIV